MNHDAHLHAEEGEDRVKLPQNSFWITCMKKKANIKSNSIQNIMNHDAHLQAEEGEDRVKLPQNSMWITCMKKKAKFKSYSIQNIMMVTFMQKRLKKNTSRTPWRSPASRSG